MIAEMLRQRSAWRPQKPQKEPCTTAMYEALDAYLAGSIANEGLSPVFLGLVYAVFDWMRLGLFTGSRVSEYGQTKLRSGQRFGTIPDVLDAGPWRGMPIAFMSSDFTLYDCRGIQLDQSVSLLSHAEQVIHEVHIRFRYDKSSTNFTVRKYRRVPTAPFDAVIPVINIIRRAHQLHIPLTEPLGQFRDQMGVVKCLRDFQVTKIMRMSVRLAYPDSRHYMRIHEDRVMAHSNRVTAACALKNGGMSESDIAFALRWKPESVPTYLRDCFQGIGAAMTKAIQGAFNLSVSLC